MPSLTSAIKVEQDTAKIVEIWKKNPDFKIKDFTFEAMAGDHATLKNTLDMLAAKEAEMLPLRNLRDDLARKLNANCVQVRKGFQGYFGLDSTEYEQAGGTRAIERRTPGRKIKDLKPAA